MNTDQIIFHSDSNTCFIDGQLTDFNEEQALISSQEAFQSWKNHNNRISILKKISETLQGDHYCQVLSRASSIESYKQFAFIQSDVQYASECFSYFSKWAQKISFNYKSLTSRGCIGGVVFENCSPIVILTWLVAAPLAAGNTMVLLVTPTVSAVTLLFAELLHNSGLPAGVLNVVPVLSEDFLPDIVCKFNDLLAVVPDRLLASDRYHFSTVLKISYCQNPVLISQFADIDSVVDCFIEITKNHEAIWFPNIIYVEEPVFEPFLNILRFAVQMHNNAVGNCVPPVDIITEKENDGFEVIHLRHPFSSCYLIINHNFFDLSTSKIFDNSYVSHLVSVTPVRTIQEGVTMINKDAGLAVSLWSNDAVEITSVPFKFKYDTVWVNSANLYSPSVPISLRWPLGYGTFSGKKMFFESLTFNIPVDTKIEDTDCFYEGERNEIFPKKDISAVVRDAQMSQVYWSKLGLEKRVQCIEHIITTMEKNWANHFEIALSRTSETKWRDSIRYLNFWCSYVVDSSYERIITAVGYRVLCVAEPLGVIGILAGSALLDTLIFMIAAGLASGNSVIVGVSNDENCSVTAVELKHIFQLDVVHIIVGNSTVLWKQFIDSELVTSVWWVEGRCKGVLSKHGSKHLFEVKVVKDMTEIAEHFETCVTKPKCVWLPTL